MTHDGMPTHALAVLIEQGEKQLPIWRVACVHGEDIMLDERGDEEHIRAIYERLVEIGGPHYVFIMKSTGAFWDVWNLDERDRPLSVKDFPPSLDDDRPQGWREVERLRQALRRLQEMSDKPDPDSANFFTLVGLHKFVTDVLEQPPSTEGTSG